MTRQKHLTHPHSDAALFRTHTPTLVCACKHIRNGVFRSFKWSHLAGTATTIMPPPRLGCMLSSFRKIFSPLFSPHYLGIRVKNRGAGSPSYWVYIVVWLKAQLDSGVGLWAYQQATPQNDTTHAGMHNVLKNCVYSSSADSDTRGF